MQNFYSGCLCYVKVLENDKDTKVKIFAENAEILQPIIDYIIRLYDKHDNVSIADVLFGAWAKGYGPEIDVYAKYTLDQHPNHHIIVRHHKKNEDYAQYVLTIDGFKKES